VTSSLLAFRVECLDSLDAQGTQLWRRLRTALPTADAEGELHVGLPSRSSAPRKGLASVPQPLQAGALDDDLWSVREQLNVCPRRLISFMADCIVTYLLGKALRIEPAKDSSPMSLC
jgi:hypothetical protein